MRHLLLCVILAAGCPTEEVGDPTPVDVPAPVDDGYASCPQETRVGGFEIEPAETYTTVVGAVQDGVAPATIFEVAMSDGDCDLLHPRDLFCDPGCDPGFTCDVGNVCVDAPRNVDIGAVAVDGLSAPVEMDAIAPVDLYNFTGDLPHPAFAPGDRIELYTGEGRLGPSMVAYGVEDLEVAADSAALLEDTVTELRWTAPTADVDARVFVSVDIANHGGVPGKIVCETADDGSLDIGADLVNGLLDLGWSGFPTVALTRRSSDVAEADDGCFDFSVQSVVVLPADIDGLTSCSSPDDCPPDLTCLADLTCG
jgi:hypothetical protein